jgi:hypothetical protein
VRVRYSAMRKLLSVSARTRRYVPVPGASGSQ